MVLALADKIRWGVGVDYDHRLVNVANWLRRARGQNKVNFFVFDLEHEPLDVIEDLLPDNRADICFLLSVCMWIKKWQEVIDVAHRLSEALLFETNGSDEQQHNQIAYLQEKYAHVVTLSEASSDDRQPRRRLLLLTKPI
jgi:hypothetical protein